MPNLTWKGMAIKIDNAAGTLTAITSSVNSASIEAVQDTLEDSSLADEERSYVAGMAGATVPLNGFVNTTTDGIFGPLLGNRTTATKTFEYYTGAKYYNGETLITDVSYSGAPNTLQMFSATLTFDGLVNRTSVALA